MVRKNPERAQEQPFKAVVERDTAWLSAIYRHVPELVKGVTEAFGGITTEALETVATAWMNGRSRRCAM
jgi:hypothetical protein